MKWIGNILVCAVLFLPLVAVGGAVMARDLWLMHSVRWTRRRTP